MILPTLTATLFNLNLTYCVASESTAHRKQTAERNVVLHN